MLVILGGILVALLAEERKWLVVKNENVQLISDKSFGKMNEERMDCESHHQLNRKHNVRYGFQEWKRILFRKWSNYEWQFLTW